MQLRRSDRRCDLADAEIALAVLLDVHARSGVAVRAPQRLHTPLSRANMLSIALLTLGAALPMRFWTSAA